MEKIWEKEFIMPTVPSVDSLNSSNDILTIRLENPKGEIIFNNYFLFKFSQESYVLRTIQNHNPDGNFFMFKSHNSGFLEWFKDESFGIYENEAIHYRFIFFGHIVEVLSSTDPIIKF